MKIYIKNMVSTRCKLIVKAELKKLDIQYSVINLGEVEIAEDISPEDQIRLNVNLKKSGLEIITEKNSILIEKIKNLIIDRIHYSEDIIKVNFSTYLSEKLDYDYTYLANIFSEKTAHTIEHYYLNHKIERVKELLLYNELNVSEIADKLHYSNVAHLSNQFKKMTGLTPSQYKHLKSKKRTLLEKV